MTKITGEDKLLSATAKKRFSKFRHFGTGQFGHSQFGAEDIHLIKTEYGDTTLGVDKYANMIPLSGIFRERVYSDGKRSYREPFYIPKNPRTEAQQTNRQKYAAAILAWQDLPDPEKELWRTKAMSQKMSGFNLFVSDYLLTH